MVEGREDVEVTRWSGLGTVLWVVEVVVDVVVVGVVVVVVLVVVVDVVLGVATSVVALGGINHGGNDLAVVAGVWIGSQV